MFSKRLSAAVLSIIIAAYPVFHAPKVEATGIPTVDIAALVQKLVEYAQLLRDYSEQLYQSKVVANEYVQKLKEMEQIYREYEHTLKQIRGIKDFVDNNEWEAILKQIEIDFPLNPLDAHWDEWGVSIYTQDGVIEVDKAIGNVYKRIRNLDTVYEDIDTVFKGSDARDLQKQEAKRHFLKSREATEQKYATEVFTAQNQNLSNALRDLSEKREVLATVDESELATLQIISMQQELDLNYKKAQQELMIKMFDMSNQESMERKNRESYVYDMMLLDKIEVAGEEKYTPDPTRNHTADF